MRESLGVPDTQKNRKVAGELRASVCFSIKTGKFNYAAQFPDSPNLKRFGAESKEITVLELKSMEISTNAMSRYSSIARNMVPRFGGDRLVSALTQENLLFIRKELLTGYHTLTTGQKTPVKGRSVRTVNYYIKIMGGMIKFATESGYFRTNPFTGIAMLKRSRCEPDPLTREEFVRMVNACAHQQLKNMWSLAFYTGVRHGELVSLAWEDIDLKAGTMMIRRNHTLTKEFTLPKTEVGTDRIINLIQPAIDVLTNQTELTRLGKQYQVEVKLREYGRTDVHPCTFVFNPQSASRSRAGHHYAVGSINQSWEAGFAIAEHTSPDTRMHVGH